MANKNWNDTPYVAGDCVRDVEEWNNMVTCTINKDCKYIIYKSGATYYALNGTTGNVDSENASAHIVMQYAIDNGGAGRISIICDITITAGITGDDDVILDGNGHTITPSTSFNIITMYPGFTIKNFKFDVTGLTFNHACILFDGGTANYFGGVAHIIHSTKVENCHGYSASSKGIFVHFLCDAPTEDIFGCHVKDCTTRLFEYGYKLEATADDGSCWINGNYFSNLLGNADKYFIYLAETGDGGVCANVFTFLFQCEAETHTGLTIDGNGNHFHGMVWDLTGAMVGVTFAVTSDHNFFSTPAINPIYVNDLGSDNIIFDQDLLGFQAADQVAFFRNQTDNPKVLIYGNDGGVSKYAYFYVNSDGIFVIQTSTADAIRINSAGVLQLQYNGDSGISCFISCDTDENPQLQVWGRNNADNAGEHVDIQWGNGVHEDGEISTSSGNLRLTPNSGIVQFGTYAAKGAEVFAGYITINDTAGNARKVMVCA